MFLRVIENTHGLIRKALFLKGKTSNQSIAVSNLDNGMYTLRLNNENGSLTSKFFKK